MRKDKTMKRMILNGTVFLIVSAWSQVQAATASLPAGTWETRHGDVCARYSLATNHTGILNVNGFDHYFTWELKGGDVIDGLVIGGRGTTRPLVAKFDREKNLIRMDVPDEIKARGFTGEFKFVGPEVLTNLTDTCELAKKEIMYCDWVNRAHSATKKENVHEFVSFEELFNMTAVEEKNLCIETIDNDFPGVFIRNTEGIENCVRVCFSVGRKFGLNAKQFPMATEETASRSGKENIAEMDEGLSKKECEKIVTLAQKYGFSPKVYMCDYDGRFSYWAQSKIFIQVMPKNYDNLMPFLHECFDGKMKFPRVAEVTEMERELKDRPDLIIRRKNRNK